MPRPEPGRGLDADQLFEELPGIIANVNAQRGTTYDGVADFAIASHLGVTPVEVAAAIDRLAAAGRIESVTRTNSYGGEFKVVRPAPRPGAGTPLPPPLYTGPEPDADSVQAALTVLDALEDIEQELINAGIYETFVEPEEVARRAGLELRLTLEHLDVLLRDFQVIWPAKDRVRSRISEICRLLKGVKQRFKADDAMDAPYLIRSLKVEFRSRRRQRRGSELIGPLSALATEFQGRRTAIGVAAEALAMAMGNVFKDGLRLTRVQEQALRGIGAAYLRRDARNTSYVVTGDTGSGKTEAFALPLMLGAAEEVLAGVKGTKVILVYPRIRLAVNQAQRLTRYLAALEHAPGGVALSLGIQYGKTPAVASELAGMTPVGDGVKFAGFLCPACETGQLAIVPTHGTVYARLACTAPPCTWAYDRFAATRSAIREAPPDILITTTESLHRWLMEPNSARVFGLGPESGFAPPRAIVFDEIHLYDNMHGAQVTRLVRRLRHRIEAAMQLWTAASQDVPWKTPLLIGMSATIGDPAAFWQKFTGHHPTVFSPAETDFDRGTAGRDYHIFLRPESESRGRPVSTASASIQSLMVLMRNMRKRRTKAGPKHRGLVFVEAIDKLKRLHGDYRDAEEAQRLWELRIPEVEGGDPHAAQEPGPAELPGFADAESWYFDAQDPGQFAENRTVRGDRPAPLAVAAQTVYSGADDLDDVLARSDLLFATTSLEVGFDDPALQLIFQHRAPRNSASFVQKKGRGGRQFGDRSIMAVMLSAESYLDAFYYQNHLLLVEPDDYAPSLNEDNYFVQRGHALAAALDAAAFTHARSATRGRVGTSRWYNKDTEALRLQLQADRRASDREMVEAFYQVTSKEFRHRERKLDGVWEDFLDSVRGNIRAIDGIAGASPRIPANLFSSVNLPLVEVERPDASGTISMDVNLAVGELAPGNVTRRFGNLDLFWTAPVPLNGAVAFVKERQIEHAFNAAEAVLIQGLAPGFADRLPKAVRQLYPAGAPERFFCPQHLYLARFGTYGRPGMAPLIDWWYCVDCDRTVPARSWRAQEGKCRGCGERLRRLGPKTFGRMLSFPLVSTPVPAAELVPAPGVLSRLFYDVQVFAGYNTQDSSESYLSFVNLIYGSEVTYRVERPRSRATDPVSHTYTTRTPQAAGAEPIFYGFGVRAEGIGFEFQPGALEAAATRAAKSLTDRERGWLVRAQLAATMLTDGPHVGDVFAKAALSEFVATALSLRATATAWTDGAARSAAINEAARYWLHAQRFSDDHLALFRQMLGSEEWIAFVTTAIQRAEDPRETAAFLTDTAAHSLEHALRSMFTIIGGVDEREVAGTVELVQLGTGAPRTIYVVERGEWGNGATRAVHDLLRAKDAPERSWRHIWRATASCPVGDEEDFLRWLLRERAEVLRRAQADLRANGRSSEARHIPLRYVMEAVGRPYNVASHIAALSRLVLGTESTGGETFAQLDLYLEVDHIATELERGFGRRPTSVELSNFVLRRVDEEPTAFPALARLRAVYRELAGREDEGGASEGEEADEGGQATPDYLEIDERRGRADEVRFVTLVERYALSSCIDGCPACFGGACDLAAPALSHQLLSRRLLRAIFLDVLAAEAVDIDAAVGAASAAALVLSGAPANWRVVRGRDPVRYAAVYQLLLRDLSPFEEIVDYVRGETYAIFRKAADAGS